MTDRRALFVNVRRSQIKRWSVTAAYREPTARWLLKNGNCVTPSAHNHAEIFRRYSGVLGMPHALQILDSNLPPDSIHVGLRRLGARSAICIGVLVMGTERLPRNKQGRLAELSLRVGKRGDGHATTCTGCLRRMPCFEGFWLNWISSLKGSLPQGNSHQFTAEPLRLTNAA